jgi:hypothetical protein
MLLIRVKIMRTLNKQTFSADALQRNAVPGLPGEGATMGSVKAPKGQDEFTMISDRRRRSELSYSKTGSRWVVLHSFVVAVARSRASVSALRK